MTRAWTLSVSFSFQAYHSGWLPDCRAELRSPSSIGPLRLTFASRSGRISWRGWIEPHSRFTTKFTCRTLPWLSTGPHESATCPTGGSRWNWTRDLQPFRDLGSGFGDYATGLAA